MGNKELVGEAGVSCFFIRWKVSLPVSRALTQQDLPTLKVMAANLGIPEERVSLSQHGHRIIIDVHDLNMRFRDMVRFGRRYRRDFVAWRNAERVESPAPRNNHNEVYA